MYGNGWWFLGMHAIWWLFGLALLFAFFALIRSAQGSHIRRRDLPLEILQRRFASGEISDDEYEHRKATLERDAATMEGK